MKDTPRERVLSEYGPIYIHSYKHRVLGPSRAEVSFNYLF